MSANVKEREKERKRDSPIAKASHLNQYIKLKPTLGEVDIAVAVKIIFVANVNKSEVLKNQPAGSSC